MQKRPLSIFGLERLNWVFKSIGIYRDLLFAFHIKQSRMFYWHGIAGFAIIAFVQKWAATDLWAMIQQKISHAFQRRELCLLPAFRIGRP